MVRFLSSNKTDHCKETIILRIIMEFSIDFLEFGMEDKKDYIESNLLLVIVGTIIINSNRRGSLELDTLL